MRRPFSRLKRPDNQSVVSQTSSKKNRTKRNKKEIKKDKRRKFCQYWLVFVMARTFGIILVCVFIVTVKAFHLLPGAGWALGTAILKTTLFFNGDISTLQLAKAPESVAVQQSAPKPLDGLSKASQELLTKYPAASQSAAAVVGQWVDSNVGAPVAGFGKVWAASPLKRDIDAISQEPTSKVTADFVGYIAEKAGPNLAKVSAGGEEVGAKITAKWTGESAKFLESNPDLKLTTSEYLVKTFGGLNSAISEPVGGLPSFPSIGAFSVSTELPAFDIPTIDLPEIDVDAIQEATSRAGTKFNSQLAEKGAELSRNTQSSISATGGAIDLITSDFKKNLPTVLDAANKAPLAIKSGLESKLATFQATSDAVVIPKENLFTKGYANLQKGSKYKPPSKIIDFDKIKADFTRGTNDLQTKVQESEFRKLDIDASQFQKQVLDGVDAVNAAVKTVKSTVDELPIPTK